MKITGFLAKENREVERRSYMIWPDSAWQRNGKPVFIAEDEEFEICISPAIKIGKVGKTVGRKFAGRYYDEAALTAVKIKKRVSEESRGGRVVAAVADMVSDGSVTTGEFKDKNFWREVKNINIAISPLFTKEGGKDREIAIKFDSEEFFALADSAVTAASLDNTLKTGDLIIPYLYMATTRAEADTKISATALDETILTTKIK